MDEPLDNEVWKDITGFEGIYQISSHGRLKSFKASMAGRVLSNVNSGGGYFSVVLRHKEIGPRYVRMHVLVAEAFIPNPSSLPEVNHKDHNKQNTHVDNLEWVTRLQSAADAISHNPNIIKGMNHYNQFVRPKTIQQFSLGGQFIAEFANSQLAQDATGVCQRNILQVANQTEYKPGLTRRQAGGFIWRFKDGV